MKIAVVFPGQGSQSVGMLRSFEAVPAVRETLNEADATLGYALSKLIAEGPEATLNETAYTQPALFVASVAMWRTLADRLPEAPAYFAGHSLGEYAAYVAAGRISFSDALKLVQFRASRMTEVAAKHPGGMAAVLGLEEKEVVGICEEVKKSSFVATANFNSPKQIVIAGTPEGLALAKARAEELGARHVIALRVSAAFHTRIFSEVSKDLKEKLSAVEISKEIVPVIANLDAASHREASDVRVTLADQASHPVQWTKTQRLFEESHVEALLEVGPGRTLTGLAKRTLSGVKLLNYSDFSALDTLVETL